jgi:GDP-L-fucose synthase
MASASAIRDGIPTDAPVFVAGHSGLVGSALVRRLRAGGFSNVLTVPRDQLDLRDQAAVHEWFVHHRPRYVYVAAGTVGGIQPNSTRPGDFIYDNLMIHANVINASKLVGVDKLLYLGSSCIYPRLAPQPITESALLSGQLEPTNEAYAVAKIAGITLCQAYRRQHGCRFISAIPTNLYGPNDNFDLDRGHVIPALMRRFHEAKAAGEGHVTVWGSGTPRREFLHVDDLADACVLLMERYDDDQPINIGTGQDVTINQLAQLLRSVIDPTLALVFDDTKPDGMPRKLLDVSRLDSMGWKPLVGLREGLASTYQWFVDHPDARGMS